MYRDLSAASGPSFTPHWAIYQAIIQECAACTILASDTALPIDLVEFPSSASLAAQAGYYTLSGLLGRGSTGQASDSVYLVTQAGADRAAPFISVQDIYGAQSPTDPSRECKYVGIYSFDRPEGEARSTDRMQLILKKLLHNNRLPNSNCGLLWLWKTQERGPHLIPGYGICQYFVVKAEVMTRDLT